MVGLLLFPGTRLLPRADSAKGSGLSQADPLFFAEPNKDSVPDDRAVLVVLILVASKDFSRIIGGALVILWPYFG